MPKIKIKDFSGIFTDIDENDNRLELVKDSENFFHKNGYLQIDPRNLTERSSMPDPNSDIPNQTWTFETGIYTTLSSDLLTTSLTPVPTKNDVIIIIAKATDSGTYHRLVYMYDLTANPGYWYQMSKHGNYAQAGGESVIDILNNNEDGTFVEPNSSVLSSFFSTTIDGSVHFQITDGRLKLYFPHDTFWLGKIDRKIIVGDVKKRWPIPSGGGKMSYPHYDYEQDYWYIDRATEDWDHLGQRINYLTYNTEQKLYPGGPVGDQTSYMCAHVDVEGQTDMRRTGVMMQVVPNTDTSAIVGAREIIIGEGHDWTIRHNKEEGYIRSFRHSIADAETGVGVTNPSLPFPAYPDIWVWHLDKDLTTSVGPGNWEFVEADKPGMFIAFSTSNAALFRLESGNAWSTLPSYVKKSAISVWHDSGTTVIVGGMEFVISLEDLFDNTIEYSGDQTIDQIGWEAGDNEFGIVATLVLDEREEIPVYQNNFSITVTGKYALKIENIRFPWDINKRMTRLRIYHRLKDGADYDMVKEFNLLEVESSIDNIEFTVEDYSGTSLAANIQFLWDTWEHPGDLKIVSGFTDFVTEAGISIAIASNDEVGVYHSTYGGGNLMPDLIYDDNRLAVTGISNLNAVGAADGRLMAFTDNTAYVIHAQEISGIIGFRFEDTVELGVKNKNDIANIQGGVCVHTIHGIYITNGYQTQLVSAPIDDIVTANYLTGRIYYNKYKHEIYYKPTDAEDLYRYRMKDAVWERTDKTITEGGIQTEHQVEAD